MAFVGKEIDIMNSYKLDLGEVCCIGRQAVAEGVCFGE